MPSEATATLSSTSVKAAVMTELSNMQVAVSKLHQLIKGSTPLASGLTVVKDLDKLSRAIERVRAEIGGLPI